jgi:uncharacterized protein with PIN domain
MKFETHIEPENNLRFHRISERVSFDELHDTLRNIYEDKNFDKTLNSLWDLSEADISDLTSDEVEQIANFVAQNWGKIPGTKAALIVNTDFSYGMARLYEILLDSRTSNTIRVFRDERSAREWLGEK